MMSRATVLACIGLMLAPGGADAAGTVVISTTTVGFQAGAAIANDLAVTTTPGSITFTDAADVINEAETDCDGNGTNTVTCTSSSGFTRADARLEDMNDRLRAAGSIPVQILGGAGDDELTVLVRQSPAVGNSIISAGEGNDRITGGDGEESAGGEAGTDTIATGAGDDLGIAGAGDGDSVDLGPGNDFASLSADLDGTGDTWAGGPGLDRIFNFAFTGAPPVDLVLDMAAGTSSGTNTGAMTLSGFEDADLFGFASTNVRGTPGSNSITSFGSADTVDPGLGSDFLALGDGADRALLRDGSADFVNCGADEDTAEVDQLDTTSDCENVSVAQVRPAAAELGVAGCTIASVRSRIARKALLRRGLRGAVECARPASLELRLLARAAPRGGGIGVARAGDVVLAERSLPLAGGRRTVRLRVIRRLRASVPRTARLRLQVVARDEFGNTQVVTKRLRVTSPRVRAR